MKWIVFLFGCGGIAILITGGVWMGKRYLLQQRGTHTQGKIVEITDPDYSTFIEFTTKSGEKIRFKASQPGKSTPDPDRQVGSPIGVVYDPAKPYEALATTTSEFWVAPVAVAVIGLIMAALGIGIFFSMGSMDREMAESEAEMSRDMLMLDPKALKLKGSVLETRPAADRTAGVVIVCSGKVLDGSSRLFTTPPMELEAGIDIRGKDVDIYIDPFDRERYLVNIDAVIAAVKQERAQGAHR